MESQLRPTWQRRGASSQHSSSYEVAGLKRSTSKVWCACGAIVPTVHYACG